MNITKESKLKLDEDGINYKFSRKEKNEFLIMLILLSILIITIAISISTGRYAIPIKNLSNIIIGKTFGLKRTWTSTMETVLIDVRIPRIIAAVMVGGALSVSGCSYQGLFKNPMVSPDILGASAGASFGAAISILLSFSGIKIELIAFLCAILAVGISCFLSVLIGQGKNITLILVLTGMVVQSIFMAFVSIIKYVADPDGKLPAITFWLMGGLTTITWKDVSLIMLPMIASMVPIFLVRYKINVLSFGEEEAQSMGVNTKRIRTIIILCSTLLTAISVSISGMIGWVGLVIPHISRLIVGPNYKILLPTSFFIGGIFLLIVDNFARNLFAMEIPLGILTSIIGAPFFLYLILRGKGDMI